MGEVADSHLVLLLDVGQEWPLVVDAEREDAVLVGDGKAGAIYGAVLCSVRWGEGETVEWREHGKLDLKSILGWQLKWNEPVIAILGKLNVESLYSQLPRVQ